MVAMLYSTHVSMTSCWRDDMIDDLKFRLGSSSGFSQRSKCARGDSELVTEDKKKLFVIAEKERSNLSHP
jgi:hypothetical protein